MFKKLLHIQKYNFHVIKNGLGGMLRLLGFADHDILVNHSSLFKSCIFLLYLYSKLMENTAIRCERMPIVSIYQTYLIRFYCLVFTPLFFYAFVDLKMLASI